MRYRDTVPDRFRPDQGLGNAASSSPATISGCARRANTRPGLSFRDPLLISTSFADIFYNNCFKNGILPIAVSEADSTGLDRQGARAT
jgi:3-isopropylmalate/(R)-2-methylmalate dehydratase small subunit